MSKIEEELLKVTGVKPRRGEKRQTYLPRLLDAAYKAADDDATWANMSKEAQKWVNDNATAEKDKRPVGEFPDAEQTADAGDKGGGEADAKSGGSNMAKTAAAKKGGSKKTASKPTSSSKSASKPVSKKTASAPTPRKQATGNSTRKPGGMSAVAQLKHFLCDDPTMDKEKLSSKLKQKGMKLTDVTISTIRSDFLAHCRVLSARGKLVRGFFKETQAKS